MRKIIIDTREKKPLVFKEPTSRAKLDTGDYSLYGLTKTVTVEYKSLADFLLWLAVRDTRKEQITRLLTYEYKAIVVGGSFLAKNKWSKLDTEVIAKRTSSLVALGIPVVFAGGRLGAARFIRNFLREAERQWTLR